MEEDFQQAKGQAGLDHTQVRRYRSWLRHSILAVAALAVQAVAAAVHRRDHPTPVLPTHADDLPPEDCGAIALTMPETHRLLLLHDEIRAQPASIAEQRIRYHLRWSTWRRKRQARARWYHYRKRLLILDW